MVLTTFSGCQCPGIAGHKLVTKTVLVRAVESGNGQIIKAVPAFYKTGREFCIPDSADRCIQPLVWHTERMRDGALRITWTTWKNANEGLYLTEAGFYAVEVPKLAILIFSRQRTWSEQLKPVTVRMDGSTAYLPRWDRTSYQDSEEGLERKIQIK